MLEIKDLSFDVPEEDKTKEILHALNLRVDNGKFVVHPQI